MAEEGTAAAQEAAAQQQFVTQRIYTKDISFESPMTPNVFRQEWKPAVNVDLNTKSSRVDEEGNHEVVLTLTITAKLEEQTAFLVEVQQAGIFFVAGIEGDALSSLWRASGTLMASTRGRDLTALAAVQQVFDELSAVS